MVPLPKSSRGRATVLANAPSSDARYLTGAGH